MLDKYAIVYTFFLRNNVSLVFIVKNIFIDQDLRLLYNSSTLTVLLLSFFINSYLFISPIRGANVHSIEN